MKKIIRSKLFILAVGIFLGIGTLVLADNLLASEISYDSGTVADALNDLYGKATNDINSNSIATLLSGNPLTVGSKYAISVGDGSIRYFYVLDVRSTEVDLIMDRNINYEMIDYNTAMSYFTTGIGSSFSSTWSNVEQVKLPTAQQIANASNMTGWNETTSTTGSYLGLNDSNDTSQRSNYSWLYNYLRKCNSYGCTIEYPDLDGYPYSYWTSSLVANNSSRAWGVQRGGSIGDYSISNTTRCGVRPVITVLKSNLYSE